MTVLYKKVTSGAEREGEREGERDGKRGGAERGRENLNLNLNLNLFIFYNGYKLGRMPLFIRPLNKIIDNRLINKVQ